MFDKLRRHKIRDQLIMVYVAAILIPISIVGTYFLKTMSESQENYYRDLLKSYNEGVSQTLYEITSQIYTISDSIVYNDDLIRFLNGKYDTVTEMRQAADDTELLDKYVEKYAGVEEIRVYMDREDMESYGQFVKVNDTIRNTDWYKKACEQYRPFWMAYQSESAQGRNLNWNLTLVRKMVLVGGDREAVIMIKVRSSYLGSRTENSRYISMIAVDDQSVAFSNRMSWYGRKPTAEIIYENPLYCYEGTQEIDGQDSLVYLTTLTLKNSGNYLYLITYDCDALTNIARLLRIGAYVLAAAMFLPMAAVIAFSGRFSKQVKTLRVEMGKASRGEYNEMSDELVGSEELMAAFEDLLVMVDNIQRMEAEQYEVQLREKNLLNEQQQMEFKMLSNQINPHFLYNTLETIRMKALTSGDREVANAIKLLGKSLRHVLNNTGLKDTTLAAELEHVQTYLQIQQLRFGERVNYEIAVEEGINPERCLVMALLLQPIVENSITHGLEGVEGVGKVRISIDSCPAGISVNVTDNGCGMTVEELEAINRRLNDFKAELPTSNIGLYNINRRIKLSYGDDYGLYISSDEGEGTSVTMILPLINGD